MPREWQDECEALEDEEMASAITTELYAGLRSELPLDRQIKTYPRIICLGMLHHQRNLTTNEAKESFKKYAIAGIISHLPNDKDLHYANMMLEVLPTHTTEVYLQFANHCSYLEMERLLLGKPDIFRRELYQSLITKEPLCAWCKQEKIIYTRKEKKRIHEAMRSVLRDRIDTLSAKWSAWAAEAGDDREKLRRTLMGQHAKARSEQEITSLVDIVDLATTKGDAMLAPITAEIANSYLALIDKFEGPPEVAR